MFKLINDTTGTYRLTIEYKEHEYRYTARCISREAGEELWFIWAKNKMIRIIYNTARKELREDLLPTQPATIPADFMEVLKEAFRSK